MSNLRLWMFKALILIPLHAFSPDADSSLDVVIVIDRTRSIGGGNYKKMLTSVEKFIGKFDLSENTTHFAMVTFAENAEIRVNLTDTKYYSLETWSQLIQEMKKKDKLGSRTRTDRALRMVCENVFVPENGDRPESPNILILLTDGNTHKASEPYDTAMQGCKGTNIHRVAVGIGPNINQSQLEVIAGDKNNVIMVNSFKNLTEYLDNISQIANAPVTSPPKPCKEHLDIAVIIDSSDRISSADYDIFRRYLTQLAERLQISEAGTHMAILLCSWEAHTWHRFSDNQTISAVKFKANSLPHSRGGPRIDRALELAAEDLFGWEDSGDRPAKPNALIVLTYGDTYGENTPYARVVPPLDEAKVRRIAVGVGYEFREHELGKIASNSSYVLKFFGINEIFSKLEDVTKLVCDQQDIGDCGDWGSYGACSKTCGRGVQVRTRTCPRNSVHLSKQKKHCNTKLCPGQKLCEDKQKNCPIRAASGDCWKTAQPSATFYVGKKFPLWNICPKSCRRCNADPCEDSDPYVCPWWSQARVNKRKCRFIFPSGGRIATLKEMCRRSCRQCPARGDCKDAFPRCYSVVRFRGCRHRRVKQNCPKSCGLCGGGSPAGNRGNHNIWPNIHENRHPGEVVHGKVYPWGR